MYLKTIDIYGFKSFPDKIKLVFEKGITAVVGPNGSGKSNIADCVRWVLGEQSSKSLRGQKMEDVIFAGSHSRKPMSYAEVTLTLDNTSETIPDNFSEISITRKVFRSGESEYYINNIPSRLKDIHNLFMDTGIGREGYSIVGQGKIDEILNSKSEDRREIFEEAAGIVKYKARRQEAFIKIEKEKQNLLRVDDIISEISQTLQPLEEDSNKAKQFIEISNKLKLYDINLFLHEEIRLKDVIESLNTQISELTLTADERSNLKTKLETEKENMKEKFNEANKNSSIISNEVFNLRTSTEKAQGEINVYNEQIQNNNKNISRQKETINSLNNKILDNNNSIQMLTSKRDRDNLILKSKRADIKDSESNLDELSSLLSETEDQIEKNNTDIINKMNIISDIKQKIVLLNSKKEQTINNNNYINENIIKGKSLLTQIETEINATNSDISGIIEKKDELLSKRKDLIISDNQKKLEQSTVNKDLSILNKSYNETNTKLKILRDMERDNEGYYKSVKSILNLKDDLFQGVYGAVGSIIKTPAVYETAIEVSLGANMQSIITDNEETAKSAISYLKQNKLGRATFLPITAARINTSTNKFHSDSLTNFNGFIGIAKDLVKFDPLFENVITNLLGRIVIMDNLDNAVELSKKTAYSYRIVTLSGEIISSNSITGGSQNDKRLNVFSRTREINGLSQKVAEIVPAIEEQNEQYESINNILAEINNELNKITEEYTKIENLHNGLEEKKSRQIKEKETLQKQLEQNELGYKETNKKLLSEDEELNIELENLSIIENNLNELIKTNQISQDDIRYDKEKRELRLNAVTTLKIEENEISQDIKNISAQILRIIDENIEIENTIKSQNEEILSMGNKLKKSVVLIENKKKEIEKNKMEEESALERLLEIENIKNNIEDSMKEKEESLKNLESEIYNISKELIRFQNKHEQSEDDLNRIYDNMWDLYEMTPREAKNYEKLSISPLEISKNIKIMKNEIKLLGSVNLGAIEQFIESKNRYELLTNQRDDIIEAEKKLQEIIAELTELMKAKFEEQFKLISVSFNTVFNHMFGGGSASLSLTDSNKPLESGIDIVAKLPGKNSQHISWLSGGEKALTAISLLFGILNLKPSPFCILDEIEASLDDANVLRFSNYLQRYGNASQFIVITHRKGTMEAADILYGVTMQEQGVSKLVSVKFGEEAI